MQKETSDVDSYHQEPKLLKIHEKIKRESIKQVCYWRFNLLGLQRLASPFH